MDEVDKIFAEDPNATVVRGEQQAWLLTGDQMKVAREALGLDPNTGEPKPSTPPK